MQVVYEFPECTLTYSMRKGNGLKFNGHDYGILFCGTDGSLMLDRGGFEVIPDKVVLPYGIKLVHGDRPLRKIDLKPEKAKGVDGQDAHVRNFLECVKSRALPTCDIEIAHRSTNTCHLGNISYKLGRKLEWDVDTETFKNDPEANAHLKREPRKGYELPERLKHDLEIFMMRRTAQWLRMIGLLIELVGVVGVVRERGGNEFPQVQVPGGPRRLVGVGRRGPRLRHLADREDPPRGSQAVASRVAMRRARARLSRSSHSRPHHPAKSVWPIRCQDARTTPG